MNNHFSGVFLFRKYMFTTVTTKWKPVLIINHYITATITCSLSRSVTRALIRGGGGVYSYILPDEFLLKSVFLLKSIVFKLISKEISRADQAFMNIPPPPPINVLVTPLSNKDFNFSTNIKFLLMDTWIPFDDITHLIQFILVLC